jgi:hypothetical protein
MLSERLPGGDRQAVKTSADEAMNVFRRLGARIDLDRCEQLRSRLEQ